MYWPKVYILLLLYCFYTLFRPHADQQLASANGPSSSRNDTQSQSTSTNLTGQNQQNTANGGGIKIGPLPPNLDELKVESHAILVILNYTTHYWLTIQIALNQMNSCHILWFSSFPAGGRAEAGVKTAGLNCLGHQKWPYWTAEEFSGAAWWHQCTNIF